MNNYRVVREGRADTVVEAVGFNNQGEVVCFYKYEGENNPSEGFYASTHNTHMFRLAEVTEIIMVDEPVVS